VSFFKECPRFKPLISKLVIENALPGVICLLYDGMPYVYTYGAEILKPEPDSAIRFEDGFWNNMFHVGGEFKDSWHNEQYKAEADIEYDHMSELTIGFSTECRL